MKRKHVRVVVHIIDEKGVRSMREFGAEDFRGVSLGDFTVREPDAGTVTFRMYLARATEGKPKKGTVLLGVPGDDYRLPFYHFASAASEGKWLNSEVVDALKSGIFEGEIIAEKVTLSASRKRFESDSATVGLCAAIEEWYEKKGKKHHGQALDDRRASRYQLLGERTLKVLRGLLDNPSFSHIKSFIGNLPRGTVGRGHFEGVRVLGIQPEKSLAIGEGDAEKGKSSGSRGGGGSAKPKKENEDHIPLTVTGDRGQERNVVREGSSGLQLVHSEMADSFSLASFDRTSGTITINVQHSLWVRCDEGGGDRAVIELQEYVVIQLLVLHATWASEADRKIREDAFEKLLEPYALKILAGEYLANRRQGRPSQKNTSMVKTPVEPARIR